MIFTLLSLFFLRMEQKAIHAEDVRSSFRDGWNAAIDDVFAVAAVDDALIFADDTALPREKAHYDDKIGESFGLNTLVEGDYSTQDLTEAYSNGYHNGIVFIFATAKADVIVGHDGKNYYPDSFFQAMELKE